MRRRGSLTGVRFAGWFWIVPGQPGLWEEFHRIGVAGEGHQVFEGIDSVEAAGLDQGHEEIPGSGSVEGFVTEAVFPVDYGHLQPPFRCIIINRSPFHGLFEPIMILESWVIKLKVNIIWFKTVSGTERTKMKFTNSIPISSI